MAFTSSRLDLTKFWNEQPFSIVFYLLVLPVNVCFLIACLSKTQSFENFIIKQIAM